MPGKRGSCNRCVAVGCGRVSGTNLLSQVKMHRFPADPERRKKWVNALKCENWVPKSGSRLCNRHFISGAPSTDPLHPDYVPTIFDYTNIDKKKQSQILECYERNNKRRNILVSSQSTSAISVEQIQLYRNYSKRKEKPEEREFLKTGGVVSVVMDLDIEPPLTFSDESPEADFLIDTTPSTSRAVDLPRFQCRSVLPSHTHEPKRQESVSIKAVELVHEQLMKRIQVEEELNYLVQ